MGDLNLPRDQMDALRAVDTQLLDSLVEQCLHDESTSSVWPLHLERCGPYVAQRLREFERALADHGKAKAAKKRAETGHDARRASGNLTHAVDQMKQRVATEEREAQLFFVDDLIRAPFSLSERLTVRVNYRWRESVEDKWKHGSITFAHEVIVRPHYMLPAPTRKPTATKQERDRQDELHRSWQHLAALGLQSVRDHFRRGGDGATIPPMVHAKTDSHTGGLNNLSADF